MKSVFQIAFVAVGLAAVSIGAGTAAGANPQPSGEQLFRQRCQACHVAVAGRPAGVGPNLAGVVGRKAAATPFAYSPALKAANLTWSRTNLDRFLTGPSRMVPGTWMTMTISDRSQRAALIQYLSQAH